MSDTCSNFGCIGQTENGYGICPRCFQNEMASNENIQEDDWNLEKIVSVKGSDVELPNLDYYDETRYAVFVNGEQMKLVPVDDIEA